MTKSSSYFVPLLFLPTVIAGPGQYRTRCGEIVSIRASSTRHDHGCVGTYSDGVPEGWHKSGRILASRETINDIIGPVPDQPA